MIRGMERGLQAFLEDTHEVLQAEIRRHLNPTNPTVRSMFSLTADLLEFRAELYASRSLEQNEPKESDRAYVRALTELKDDITGWLETTEETDNG